MDETISNGKNNEEQKQNTLEEEEDKDGEYCVVDLRIEVKMMMMMMRITKMISSQELWI